MADWQKVNMNKSIPSGIRNDTQMDVRVFYLFQTGAPQSAGVNVWPMHGWSEIDSCQWSMTFLQLIYSPCSYKL